MLRHFQMFADYNRWANHCIYEACSALTEDEYHRDMGAFFGSAHKTLSHLLTADRIWLKRFTGIGDAPASLNAEPFESFEALRAARESEDQRIIDWVDNLTPDHLSAIISYSPITMPGKIEQPLASLLAHVFNHQTHHRGQVHTILTALGKPSVVLDLVYFQRGEGARWQ
ncbi:DinB family protein [Rhizobium oryzicola]|uniref:DinB family protein n=1 Tax=Rhizobium oryzicola TaxID=1232668 RepID=A0ABT8STF6_9HYPH|nr:DinB family protein [Rhizobium oryzicola]MDO1581709.1 DinB family protein [Rhizobium oryzicola]